MPRLSSFFADQRGNAAVEMALVMPMLTTLMFTCLEGAHYLFIEHQVVKGVRDGARYAARQAFSNFSCGSTTVNSTLQSNIRNVTRLGTLSSGTPRVSTWGDTDTSVSVSCATSIANAGIYTSSGLANPPRVTVSATVSYPSLFSALTGITTALKVHAADQAAVMGV